MAFFVWKYLTSLNCQPFSLKKVHRRCLSGLKIGVWKGFEILSSLFFPVFKLSRENTQLENMCGIIFEKVKGVYAEAAAQRYYDKFCRIHKKTSVPESLFLAKLNLQTCSFIKNEALLQVFSCEFCKIRKNTFFAEHHQTSASDYNSICKL